MFRRFALAAALLVGVSAAPALAQPPVTADEMAAIPKLTLADYRPLQAKGAVLTVDVRDQHAFDAGHIPGALNVSIVDIEIMGNKVLRDKRPVVAYCACPDEHSALVVAAKLKRIGVKDIRVLAGGWNGWTKGGGKVELTPTP